ncbi:MAG: hemolysin family protein [Deltaproteobacteria bacterium]|nr:hemolysin family protein [Deltaproteobacteria bacterium]
MDLTVNIVIIFILFLFSGFFSSSETSLFSLTDLHLHKMKSDRYRSLSMVDKLLENPQRLLITIVASNEMVNIAISVLAASLFIGLLGANGEWVSIIFTSVVLLIAGEAIPKTFGITYPMQISAMVSPVLTFISRVEYPFVAALEKISGLILKLHGQHEPQDADALMEDEFKTLIDTGSREGVVDESQRDLIRRIFELGDKPVTDIMIPRVDMFCLSVTMPMDEIMASVVKAQHERIPVYSDDRDDIIGILFAKELLNSTWPKGKPEGLGKLLKKPYFVPEGKTINGLLHDFQENRTQIAIVVDEYGGVSGMVTLRDILGHLFEDTYDENSPTDEDYEKIDEYIIIVSGKMPMEQLNNLLQTQFPLEEFDTVGGFVLHLFGKLPAKDEETSFEDFKFKVEKVDRARILKVKVTRETVV